MEQSLLFWRACRDKDVPVELHLYEDGPHAQGLAVENPRVSGWAPQMLAWLGGWAAPTAVQSSASKSTAIEAIRTYLASSDFMQVDEP